LGRIGASAMPEIRRIAASSNDQHRLLAYFAAGRTRSADGNAFLLSVLTADPELADISALALADSGDPAAIGPIYQALERCEPWQRPELEAALRDLNAGVRDDKEYDWRVRLRMDQMGSRFPLNWAVVASIIRSEEDARDRRGSAPVRPLQQILAEPPDEPEPDLCESCGTTKWMSTGVPVCPETAAGMAAIQARGLLRFAEDPDEDLAIVLDDLEDSHEDHRKDTRRKR